jgi:hypothetical protein
LANFGSFCCEDDSRSLIAAARAVPTIAGASADSL